MHISSVMLQNDEEKAAEQQEELLILEVLAHGGKVRRAGSLH